MRVLLDDLLLKKYRVRGIIALIILGVSSFFLMGNYHTIKYFSQIDGGNIDRTIINTCFSMSHINKFIFFLFLVWVVGFLFKDKEDEIRENISIGGDNIKKYFISKAILIYGVSLGAILINILIKMICYFPYKDIFSIDKLFISSFYFLTIGILFTSIIFTMNLIVKDKLLAGILPIFLADGMIIFFAISRILISDRLSWIRNFLNMIGEQVLLVFKLLFLDFEPSTFSALRQSLLLIILLSISALLVYLSYLLMKIVNVEYLKRPYFFEIPRYVIYVFMSMLVGFTVMTGIGYFFIMFIPSISYVNGTFIVNILSVVSMVGIFIFLEALYRKKVLVEEIEAYAQEESNEIQPYREEFIEFDETTGLLEEGKDIKEKEIFQEEENSHNKNKILEKISNFDVEEEEILKDEFNKTFKNMESEKIDHIQENKILEEDLYIDDVDDMLKNFVYDEIENETNKE
ncbi:hypothetical protein [Clostridium sp. LIBA-8841]|uniref:hypothetical protein n=1 Tax=Clostridium sp. LIBA-8841 TaxID=2987530 RepID=UPI002AC52BBC|nr:hypothetical protein [Clostridium sp. LIBA-8841]MDZ5255356.1 hypothetical protein [Clostridium sp. LIBA-8841]